MPFAEWEAVEFFEHVVIVGVVVGLFCVDIHELLIMSLKIVIFDILVLG